MNLKECQIDGETVMKILNTLSARVCKDCQGEVVKARNVLTKQLRKIKPAKEK